MDLPKVKLIPLGKKTFKGELVNADFLIQRIYSHATKKDFDFFEPPNKEEIEYMAKNGRFYFAIENEKKEIVGATAMNILGISLKDALKNKLNLIKLLNYKLAIKEKQGCFGRTLILPNFRGKGYSGASKKEIEKFAKEKGIKTISSLVHKNNFSSRNAMHKAGITKNRFRTFILFPANFLKNYFGTKENRMKEKKRGKFLVYSKKLK